MANDEEIKKIYFFCEASVMVITTKHDGLKILIILLLLK
jgi:hypothetical protein